MQIRGYGRRIAIIAIAILAGWSDNANSSIDATEGRPRIQVRLMFEPGSARLISESATANLDVIGKAFENEALMDTRFLITGHVQPDRSRTRSYEVRLSTERAEVVSRYLRKNFGMGDRLIATGLGSDSPLLDPRTAESAAMNDRVEFASLPPRSDGVFQAYSLPQESGDISLDFSFTSAPLTGLTKAALDSAILVETDFSGRSLDGASLAGANLFQANLEDSSLIGADLRRADLFAADLSRADLSDASLIDAVLEEANLDGAMLQGTDLRGADLSLAILHNVLYEPISAPRADKLVDVNGLETVYWEETPRGLMLLRQELRNAGLRNQERKVTYAIRKSARGKKHPLTSGVEFVAFEAPSSWGLEPNRPLVALIVLIPFFAIVYAAQLRRRSTEPRIWITRGGQSVGSPPETTELVATSWWEVGRWSLFLSVQSAFHIGWREVNVGSWIARLSPRPVSLETVGSVRVITGLQSLLSVYLLALWILCNFGRPFD